MCTYCTAYDSSRTEHGDTFKHGHLSFRIYEFNEEDYTLFSYICNDGEWELQYPIVKSMSTEIKVCVQEAIYFDISQQVRDCQDHRLAFLMYRS